MPCKTSFGKQKKTFYMKKNGKLVSAKGRSKRKRKKKSKKYNLVWEIDRYLK